MAARTTTQERLTNSWNKAKTKDSYYQPKIHYVAEGLKSYQSARQYLYQFNIFLKYLGLTPENDDDLVKLLTKDHEDH